MTVSIHQQCRQGVELTRWLGVPPASESGGLKLYMNAPADRRGNVDQRIQREARHPVTQQVIDARLSDSTALRRLGLRPAIPFDNGRNLPLVSILASVASR